MSNKTKIVKPIKDAWVLKSVQDSLKKDFRKLQ